MTRENSETEYFFIFEVIHIGLDLLKITFKKKS